MIILLLLGSFLFPPQSQRSDLVLADFEGETYGPWKVEGEAFGTAPARGTLAGQMPVEGFQGKGLVNSFQGGDKTIGRLSSPPFKIDRKYISFLIGGGGWDDQTCVNLLVANQIVRTASGPNTTSGGNEALQLSGWDVTEFAGKEAVFQIVDQHQGGWGHINVDHILMTDVKPKLAPEIIRNVERSWTANTRYLNIPIKNGGPKRMVTLIVEGVPVVRNEIELADENPDWWASMEVDQWRGKTLTLRVDKLPKDSKSLESIEASDSLTDATNLYRESMRGQFHFSPQRGWNNDPNGCVFYNGEYHLFFQHNPYGWSWGNMHWGHAVSPDLVHWRELGDKLLPDEMGPMFSGSAVVDWNNTSGLGIAGKPPLVLFYTAAGNPTVQCMAYSTDGRTFTKYSGNPIVPQVTAGNRDPKVVWHEASQQWVMTLYVEWQGRHTIHFFTSVNLKDWKLASFTRGDAPGGGFLFECPDLFELPIDGDHSRKKWVLLGANSDYAIGEFDGKRFLPDATHISGQKGRDFYAPQSFSDLPDGRRVLIGWWRTETKGMPFNQSMSLPLELQLRQTERGPRLSFLPVKELEMLRSKTHRFKPMSLEPGDNNPLSAIHAELVEIRAEFDPGDSKEVVFNIRDIMVIWHADQQELSVAGHRAPAPLLDGKLRLIIYCDRTGVEVFAGDGLCYMPMPYNTKAENLQHFLEIRGGTVEVLQLELHELRSAWQGISN